jgi:hypothetical protein
MSAAQWLAIGATALLLVRVGVYEARRRWRQRRRINHVLTSLRCAHYGDGFRKCAAN